ncbi:hypothetical protein BASA50_002798 [Batrachochytrium salamandrivorans]|uniref:Uncharacterized protein n=1 Tax=Batrachochytrium salamandrivorans TaxID=1357716 RepID=A0ABQ8FKC7_9FUNG|nr:hypothetical protein BASA60_008506 [Batrachochytrium salamandrivorans]KAH6599773.1 hypothetical protein BASA50_002798 [Batrachochytrium salamandrivorans]KAH9274052.1 hypothetical protein BASA83_003694 [Batrachochytrium salamandrivorans]KAJ1332460.1 hypothetical protein BSLG_008762 [Batrachochytrium salamandrivorans]
MISKSLPEGGSETTSPSQTKSKRKSKEIDKQLKKDQAAFVARNSNPLVLLLGTSDSGKTTLLKNFRMTFTTGFTLKEREDFKYIALDNIIDTMKMLISTCNEQNLFFTSPDITAAANHVSSFHRPTSALLSQTVTNDIKTLWKSSHIVNAIPYCSSIQDTACGFIERIDELNCLDYVLTDLDILQCRYKTTQISETMVTLNAESRLVGRFVDVSGMKTDRKHWLPFFDNANAVIFVVAISSFDQTLVEDSLVNRLTDALELFDHICNHPLLEQSETLVFLNKKDLFKKKLLTRRLADYFPVFKGKNTHQDGITFFQQLFFKLSRSTKRGMIVHATTCTDLASITLVLKSVV